MIANIVLTLLFALLLYSHFERVRKIDVTFVVISLYMFVAFAGAILVNIEPKFSNLALWPYVYLFGAFFIMIQPVKKATVIDIINVDRSLLGSINKLIFIYCLCAMFVIYSTWADMIMTIILGEWNNLKKDAYEGASGSSIVVEYAKAFGLYFRFLVFPYCFYLITQAKEKSWKAIIILGLCIVSTMFYYLAMAYRGGMFSIIMLLIISYILFRNNIPKRRKKIITLTGGGICALVLAITIAITNSRFENTSAGPLFSLLDYFGQSMVNFNGGIATRAKGYMGGNYFFMSERGLDKSSFWVDSKYGIDTNDGSDFDTLIGCFYIDFGPVSAFLIFVVVALIMIHLLNFRKRFWSSIFLLFFYLELLTAGVFHGPSSLFHQVFDVMAIYIVLLFSENLYGKKHKRKNNSLLPQVE